MRKKIQGTPLKKKKKKKTFKCTGVTGPKALRSQAGSNVGRERQCGAREWQQLWGWSSGSGLALGVPSKTRSDTLSRGRRGSAIKLGNKSLGYFS